ncbi:MAG: hypothetical protein KAR40_11285 [Candidatus Sabulitectum sp.]|nr:hypothetical protein [Candidatus Sabulitectum sp.]
MNMRKSFEAQFLDSESALLERKGEGYRIWETAIAWKHYQAAWKECAALNVSDSVEPRCSNEDEQKIVSDLLDEYFESVCNKPDEYFCVYAPRGKE